MICDYTLSCMIVAMFMKAYKRYLLITGLVLIGLGIAGAPLNHSLSTVNAYVSELSVKGQPFAWLFQLSQLVGAVFLLIYLLGARHTIKHRLFQVLIVTTAAVVLNSFFPMVCTPSLSAACLRQLDHYQFGYKQYIHEVTSIITFFGLMLAQFLSFWTAISKSQRQWHLANFLGQVLLNCGIAFSSFHGNRYIGLIQRVSLIGFEVWIAVTLLDLARLDSGDK